MENQTLYIRTDMNDTIATGHMMRCLSIADAVVTLGGNVTFLVADEQAVNIIRERGHQSIVMHTKWDVMEAELGILEKIINKHKIISLLIDSYMVTPNYLSELSKKLPIFYIDDLNSFVYPVHTLICYAAYWEKFGYRERYPNTRLLLGLSYTPLRKVFGGCGRKFVKNKIENLLILSGGTDNFNIIEGLLQNIELMNDTRVDVICGNYYSEYEELCHRYRHVRQIHFHKAVQNIEKYMMQADVAVSAGGTTLYELCACGTPTISYSFADNQLDNVLQFRKDNLADYAGDVRDGDISGTVNRLLEKYYCDVDFRWERSQRMQRVVDGRGAERIARVLMGNGCESKKDII